MLYIGQAADTTPANRTNLDDHEAFWLPIGQMQFGTQSFHGGIAWGTYERDANRRKNQPLEMFRDIAFGLIVAGNSRATVADNMHILQAILQQARDYAKLASTGQGVVLVYRPGPLSVETYIDVVGGRLDPYDWPGIDGDPYQGLMVTLSVRPFFRQGTQSLVTSGTISDAVGTLRVPDTGGDTDGLLRTIHTDLSNNNVIINRIRSARRSAQPLPVGAFSPIQIPVIVDAGTNFTDASARGGVTPRLPVTSQSWQNFAQVSQPNTGAAQGGEVALWARLRDSSPYVDPTDPATALTNVVANPTLGLVTPDSYIFRLACITASNAYENAVLDDSPLAYYRLDELSGTVALDQISANNATYAGSPTLGNQALIPGEVGKNSSVRVANVATTLLTIPSSVVINATDPGLTLEFWANFAAASAVSRFIMGPNSGSTFFNVSLPLTGPTVTAHAGATNAGITAVALSGSVTGAVHHWVIAYRNLAPWTITVYRDAVIVATGTGTGAFAAAVAGGTFATTAALDSYDALAIYNKELSAARVLAHYNIGSQIAGIESAAGYPVTSTVPHIVNALSVFDNFATGTLTTVYTPEQSTPPTGYNVAVPDAAYDDTYGYRSYAISSGTSIIYSRLHYSPYDIGATGGAPTTGIISVYCRFRVGSVPVADTAAKCFIAFIYSDVSLGIVTVPTTLEFGVVAGLGYIADNVWQVISPSSTAPVVYVTLVPGQWYTALATMNITSFATGSVGFNGFTLCIDNFAYYNNLTGSCTASTGGSSALLPNFKPACGTILQGSAANDVLTVDFDDIGMAKVTTFCQFVATWPAVPNVASYVLYVASLINPSVWYRILVGNVLTYTFAGPFLTPPGVLPQSRTMGVISPALVRAAIAPSNSGAVGLVPTQGGTVAVARGAWEWALIGTGILPSIPPQDGQATPAGWTIFLQAQMGGLNSSSVDCDTLVLLPLDEDQMVAEIPYAALPTQGVWTADLNRLDREGVTVTPLAAALAAGLVGLYEFLEVSGTVITDQTGNNAGVLQTATVRANDTTLLAPTGLQATLAFNGSTPYGVTFATTTNIPIGNSPYTISAWIKTTDLAHPIVLVGWGTSGTANTTTWLAITTINSGNNVNGLKMIWWTNDLNCAANIFDGLWHHVASTWDGLTRRMYVDGVIVGSDTPPAHAAVASTFFLANNSGPWAAGSALGPVRIFNRALAQSELTGFVAPNAPIAYASVAGRMSMGQGDSLLIFLVEVSDGAGHFVADLVNTRFTVGAIVTPRYETI